MLFYHATLIIHGVLDSDWVGSFMNALLIIEPRHFPN